MNNLRELRLINNDLSELNPELFSFLANLEELNLRHDLIILDYIVNIKEINIYHNPIDNKEDILNRVKQSEIKILDSIFT